MEISQLIKRITSFYSQPHDNVLINYVETIISNNQISSYLENGFSFLLKSFSDISKTSIQVLIALILSLFFLLEKPRLKEFTGKFKNSKIAPFYYEIEFFGKKFTRTFGKVIEAQFIIAIVNTYSDSDCIDDSWIPTNIWIGNHDFLFRTYSCRRSNYFTCSSYV